MKLWLGLPDTLTDNEREIYKVFLLEGRSSETEPTNDSVSLSVMDKTERKRRKLAEDVEICGDVDIAVGSAPTAERLWPLTDALLSKNRKMCSPMLLEATMYSKMNHSY